MKIILGVSGSIAAYKAAHITRLLVKDGHQVKVIMTTAAKGFITPLTLATLSKNPVLSDLFDENTGVWENHVALANWADLIIIAPLSASTLAKMAIGLCDNLLLTTYLSAICPVYASPAMDRDMYLHPSVQHNIELLKLRGNIIIPPTEGELASGLEGIGRMAEPEDIVSAIKKKSTEPLPLKGMGFLVTAGPTYEPIDPVRFIGNHSSGKMGFAIAEALAWQGAAVELVAGPVQLTVSNLSINRTDVKTADQMYQACMDIFPACTGAILSAAVADYRPADISSLKIKKDNPENEGMNLKLVKNKDILATLGTIKAKKQLLIGFSLETHDEFAFAKEKMIRKNCDMIVLNSLKDEGAGFSGDTNKITILNSDGDIVNYPLKTKNEVARDIVQYIIRRYF